MLDSPPVEPNGGTPPEWDLARLIHEHHGSLYRYAFRLTGNTADAEDLAQQTFVIAHEKLHQVRQAANVRGWLFAVLRNCFLKSRRRPRPLSGSGIDLDVRDVAEDAIAAETIDREQLQHALNALSDEFRLVLVMFYFEECSYKEIAEKLEIPLGTVMSRLSRAKQRLRERLVSENASGRATAQPERARAAASADKAGEKASATSLPRA
jgi:RNA polymerase sigma-70 factor (ECF subfamily)